MTDIDTNLPHSRPATPTEILRVIGKLGLHELYPEQRKQLPVTITIALNPERFGFPHLTRTNIVDHKTESGHTLNLNNDGWRTDLKLLPESFRTLMSEGFAQDASPVNVAPRTFNGDTIIELKYTTWEFVSRISGIVTNSSDVEPTECNYRGHIVCPLSLMERTTETTGSRERTDRVNVVIAAKDPKQSKEDGGNPHEILESLVDEKVIPSDYSTRCTTEELRAAPIIRELGIPCLVLEHMVGIYHQHNHHIATRLLERINNIQDTINRVYANVEHTLVFRTNPRDHGKTSDADVIITSPEFNGISESKRGRLFLNRWNKEEWGPIDVTAFTPEEYESNLNSSGSIVQKAESDGVRII